MNVSIVAPLNCCFAMFNSLTLAFTFTDGVLYFHMPHPSIHCPVSVSVYFLRGAFCSGRLLTLKVLSLHAVLKEQWKLLLCCLLFAVGLGSCALIVINGGVSSHTSLKCSSNNKPQPFLYLLYKDILRIEKDPL